MEYNSINQAPSPEEPISPAEHFDDDFDKYGDAPYDYYYLLVARRGMEICAPFSKGHFKKTNSFDDYAEEIVNAIVFFKTNEFSTVIKVENGKLIDDKVILVSIFKPYKLVSGKVLEEDKTHYLRMKEKKTDNVSESDALFGIIQTEQMIYILGFDGHVKKVVTQDIFLPPDDSAALYNLLVNAIDRK